MSATQMFLEDWLMAPALAGLISRPQAWEMQDLSLLTPPDEWTQLPESLRQASQAVHLYHCKPHNRLPI